MKVETIPLISHTPTYHRVILAKLIRNSILLNRTSDLQSTKFFYITKLQDIATFYPKIYNLDRYIIFRFFKQIISRKIKIDLGFKSTYLKKGYLQEIHQKLKSPFQFFAAVFKENLNNLFSFAIFFQIFCEWFNQQDWSKDYSTLIFSFSVYWVSPLLLLFSGNQ